MTAQEAIKSLEVLKALVEWGEPMEYQVALDMAIEALGKADSYRWHDLRKNPEDLPEYENGRSKDIAIQMPYETIIYRDAYYDNEDDCWRCAGNDIKYVKDRIIAWREIESFEEVEE